MYYRGLTAIKALLRVCPLHSEQSGSFGDLYLPGSLYFCRTWMSILVTMDPTSYHPVWLTCHIFPHSYSDNYTFVFAILSLQAITIISYFLSKSDMPFRNNAGYCVNSSRGLSIAVADIFAHLIRSLSHLSHNCWGFFFHQWNDFVITHLSGLPNASSTPGMNSRRLSAPFLQVTRGPGPKTVSFQILFRPWQRR